MIPSSIASHQNSTAVSKSDNDHPCGNSNNTHQADHRIASIAIPSLPLQTLPIPSGNTSNSSISYQLSYPAMSEKRKPTTTVESEKVKTFTFTETEPVDMNKLELRGSALVDYFKQNGARMTTLNFFTSPFILKLKDLVGDDFEIPDSYEGLTLDMPTMIASLKECINVKKLTIDLESDDLEMAKALLPLLTAWVLKQRQLDSLLIKISLDDEKHVEKMEDLLDASDNLRHLTVFSIGQELGKDASIDLGAMIPLTVDSLEIRIEKPMNGDTEEATLEGLSIRIGIATTTKLKIYFEDDLDTKMLKRVFEALRSYVNLTHLDLEFRMMEDINPKLYPIYIERLVAMPNLVSLKIREIDKKFPTYFASQLGRFPNLRTLELGLLTHLSDFAEALSIVDHGLKELRFPDIWGRAKGFSSILHKLPFLEIFSLSFDPFSMSKELNDLEENWLEEELETEKKSGAFKDLIAQRPSLKISLYQDGKEIG